MVVELVVGLAGVRFRVLLVASRELVGEWWRLLVPLVLVLLLPLSLF